MTALLDTSVFVALESGRPADLESIPEDASVSVITLAELEAGVLAAADAETRSQRMSTVGLLSGYRLREVDQAAARHWAILRSELHRLRRTMTVNDAWIAAIARANGLAVVTQDNGFDVLDEFGLVDVIKI